jgi:menaquinone-specific isochorismate synthase
MVKDKKQIKKHLLKELKVQLENSDRNLDDTPKIWRVTVRVPNIDLFDWLYSQKSPTKVYWSGKDHNFAMAGVGKAHVLSSSKNVNYADIFRSIKGTLLCSHPETRYWGGFRFNPNQQPSPEWKNFHLYRFIIPQFELMRKSSHTILTYNFVVKKKKSHIVQNFESHFDSLTFSKLNATQDLATYSNREDIPKWNHWEQNVNRALELFKNGPLQKIVLAKKSTLTFESHIDPILLLKKLAFISPTAFHFCFQLSPKTAFMGITPERLYRRDNGNIFSEALAGTRQRHEDNVVDDQLGLDLLHSEKDLREHRSVSDMVRSSLGPFCDSIETISKETLLKLPHVQHLHTLFKGHLHNGVSDAELISRLHPTPAVGGFPRDESISHILRMEPFDRGWYAGPVGWISKSASEFAVAIRSALVAEKTVSLYAGSGIVQGSDPQKEWEETENKILNFTRLFKHK